MDLGLAEKIALIADTTSAIGAAIRTRLSAEGCTVSSMEADGVSILQRYGRIDILVFNHLAEPEGTLAEVSAEKLEAKLRAELLEPWALLRHIEPHLKKQGSGRVIFLIDEAAKMPSAAALPAAITGAAHLALVKSLSDDFGRYGVLVNAVCAGRVTRLTPTGELERFIGRSLEQQEAGWGREVPLGRSGSPEDIANAVAYLASERAAFIVGSNIDVDGGYQRSIF